ncbi:MAG TPA: condensation domain-containing protein, partial [Pseudonocardiaceae bacterium]|nr:condensation domain-containing protein [Pseudonocardiaceae bacterium]
MVERVLIPFEGPGSGVGELTWGQLGVWRAIQRQHCSMGVGRPLPLPAGATVTAVADGLRFVMGRHQSLRTRLVFDHDGHVRQCVASEGEVPLEIVDAADDEDPAAVAVALRARYHDTEFDYANEWPVRMAVVRHCGALTHVVALYCHLALDGGGADALV